MLLVYRKLPGLSIIWEGLGGTFQKEKILTSWKNKIISWNKEETYTHLEACFWLYNSHSSFLWVLLSEGKKKRTMRYWAFLRVYSKLEPPPHYYPSLNIEENLKETRTVLHFMGQDRSHLGLESVSEFKGVCWRQECYSGVYSFPSLWLTLLAHSLEVFPLLEFHYISQWPVLKVPSVLKFSSQDQICALEITNILESGVQISDLFLPGIFLHSKPWRL